MGSQWFITKQVAQNTWAISDHYKDTMYLAVGEHSALLMDTGWGVGDLAGLVASLTPLPLIVVNTHGHPDHVMGNGQFQQVFIGKEDQDFIAQPMAPDVRNWTVKNILFPPSQPFEPSLLPNFCPETWASEVAKQIIPISEGYVFDLGRRQLEVISLPGHTPGSICLLDRQQRLLFTGDSVHNAQLWLHLEESTTLAEYQESLCHLQAWRGDFDWMLWGHGMEPIPAGHLDDLTQAVQGLVAGRFVGSYVHTFAGDGLEYRYRSGAVLYRPEKIK